MNDSHKFDKLATLEGLRHGFVLTANNGRMEPSNVRVSPETAKLMSDSIEKGQSFTSHLIPEA